MASFLKVKKPFISEKNRLARVAWAKKHKDWTLEQWEKVFWSDESPYCLRFAKRTHVWRLASEKFEPWATRATVKHDKKINVWGGFCAKGVGNLYRVPGMALEYANLCG